MGGTSDPDINSPANLVFLCRACHRDIESNRMIAAAAGWLVGMSLDPAAVPVKMDVTGYVFLTADGRYSRNPPSAVR